MNGGAVATATRAVREPRPARGLLSRVSVVPPDGVDRLRDAASTPDERPAVDRRDLDQRRSVMRSERVRLQPYVDAPLAKQLAAYSAAMGMTTSFVVQAALRQYLDRTDDKMLLLGRLNRLGRAWDRTQRDLEIHMEAFAIYVKLWFAHTPSIPDNAKDSARTNGREPLRAIPGVPRRAIPGRSPLRRRSAARSHRGRGRALQDGQRGARGSRGWRGSFGDPMKSSRLAGKRGLSKALASTTQLDGSAHP